MLNFKEVKLDNRIILENYLQNNSSTCAVYNFNCLLLWQGFYKTHYDIIDDTLIIRMGEDIDDYIYILPPTLKENTEMILEMLFNDNTLRLVAVSNELEQYLTKKYPNSEFIVERDMEEYVYLVQDLIELKGKSYHSKKNHINKFKKLYPDYQYELLNTDQLAPAYETLDEWCQLNDCKNNPNLQHENRGIRLLLNNIDKLSIKCGILKVNGKIIALTVGSQLNENTVQIHYEKAKPDYEGSYTMINNLFLANEWNQMKYVNREEDLGLPGLRKAKLSYKPVIMNKCKKAIIKK